MATWGKTHGTLSIEAWMFDSQVYPFVGRSRRLPLRDNNGRCVNQEGKHELHMIIDFGQVNTSYLSSFTAMIMCICEGDSIYCWPFSRHNGLFIWECLIKVFWTARQDYPMGGSRGGTGDPDPPPLKNYRNIGFYSNAGPDPVKNHKAAKPGFNVGPSSARQLNAI